MKKLYFILAFSFSCHFAKTQSLPVKITSALKEYFFTLPGSNEFTGWINSIEKDSTIIIDTTILNPEIDSFYFYLRCISTSFIVPIEGANYNMVIMARYRNLSSNTISIIAQMEYYLDTSENSKIRIENTYRDLNKKFRKYFSKNIERKSRKKGNATNNYYLKGEHSPAFVISRGKYYKDRSYCLIITLNYTLTDPKNISL
jgi:hypothetical protein